MNIIRKSLAAGDSSNLCKDISFIFNETRQFKPMIGLQPNDKNIYPFVFVIDQT